jgi:hypothetical protein
LKKRNKDKLKQNQGEWEKVKLRETRQKCKGEAGGG